MVKQSFRLRLPYNDALYTMQCTRKCHEVQEPFFDRTIFWPLGPLFRQLAGSSRPRLAIQRLSCADGSLRCSMYYGWHLDVVARRFTPCLISHGAAYDEHRYTANQAGHTATPNRGGYPPSDHVGRSGPWGQDCGVAACQAVGRGKHSGEGSAI